MSRYHEAAVRAARKQVIEKFNTTDLCDGMNEGGLPQLDALLKAYLSKDETEAGRVLFQIIESYVDDLVEDEDVTEIERELQRDAAESRYEASSDNAMDLAA